MNSTSTQNDSRFYLLQLQVILHALIDDMKIVNGLALLIAGLIAATFAWRQRGTRQNDDLLSLSAVSFLALVPVYHRFYDAALLVVPLTWAIARLRDKPHFAWPILLVVSTFLIPIAAVPRFEQLLGYAPYELSTWWWHLLIEPWRTWCLMSGLTLSIIAIGARRSSLV